MSLLPKALQIPRVAYTEHFGSVVLRVPINPEDANEYQEVTLDRHSARRLGLELMMDAERAAEWERAQARRRG